MNKDNQNTGYQVVQSGWEAVAFDDRVYTQKSDARKRLKDWAEDKQKEIDQEKEAFDDSVEQDVEKVNEDYYKTNMVDMYIQEVTIYN